MLNRSDIELGKIVVGKLILFTCFHINANVEFDATFANVKRRAERAGWLETFREWAEL